MYCGAVITPAETEMLHRVLGTSAGYAVEAGAANGKFESPTYPLECAGWKVLCCEPNPMFAEYARSIRDLVEEVAIADYSADDAEFTLCNTGDGEPDWKMQGGSALNVKYDKLAAIGWTPRGERKIKVRVRTLDELLTLHNFPQLDFLVLDVEGGEDAALRGLNVAKWMPRVISVENWPGDNKTDTILLPLGYKKIERVTGNFTDWYAL